ALCGDVLGRLERAHLHDAMHCADHMARPVRRELFGAALGRRDIDADRPDVTARWGEAVLRFALWTSVLASPPGARVLAWAATPSWFLPQTLSEAHGEELLAAARAVIEATPDFMADSKNGETEAGIAYPHAGPPGAKGADTDASTRVPPDSDED